jgi:hypothetical protein
LAGTHCTSGTTALVDNDLLPERFGKTVGNDPRNNPRAATRRERVDKV